MGLSSLQIDAFIAVARSGSFSAGANVLNITQSALSQRVLKLEEELETTLFLREPTGIRLTETGERLLHCASTRELLENEFLSSLRSSNQKELSGLLKVAGFSTFVRSRLLPELGRFGRKHPEVTIEVLTREIRDLPRLLNSGAADFVFSTEEIQKQAINCRLIGHEENVLIESSAHKSSSETFIDHDELDTTTSEFWKVQKTRPQKYKRIYFDEIYTIINAVEEGLGKAVVPRHLIEKNKKISIVKGMKPLRIPIYLCYFQQVYMTRLQKEFMELFPEG